MTKFIRSAKGKLIDFDELSRTQKAPAQQVRREVKKKQKPIVQRRVKGNVVKEAPQFDDSEVTLEPILEPASEIGGAKRKKKR